MFRNIMHYFKLIDDDDDDDDNDDDTESYNLHNSKVSFVWFSNISFYIH